MSYQQLSHDTLFYQRMLKANGFYSGTLDGSWGPKTDAADAAFRAESERIAAQSGKFDPRSEANLITLTPKAQLMARKFLALMKTAGKDVRILSGTRTYAEQNALYEQGRHGHPGPIVTNAKGGESNHNFGVAWDIGLFESGQYITDDKKYLPLAAIVKSIQGLEWGGDWHSFKDYPHYQCKCLKTDIAGIRTDFESGMAYV